MRSLKFVLFLALIILFLTTVVISCGDDDDDDDSSVTDDDDDADDDDSDDDDDDDDDDDSADPFDEAEANLGSWVWIPVEGAMCRDGSPAGFGVRLQEGATKLAIHFEGGGACYDQSSCDDNASSYDAADLSSWAVTGGTEGIFNNDNTDNPVTGWNFIFISYCTGDLHAGNNPGMSPPGMDEIQQYVGYANTTSFMAVIGDYFTDMTQVFLNGSSAGAWGSLFNYTQVAEAFDGVQVIYMNDSGPLVELDEALAPCYQGLLHIIWNPVTPEGCTDCVQENFDGMSNLFPYLSTTYPGAFFGLFSSLEDETIRDYWGMGQNSCNGTTPIPGPIYTQGLNEMRDDVLIPTGKWGTYYINGDSHTILTSESMLYSTEVGGKTMVEWINDLLDGTVSQVSP